MKSRYLWGYVATCTILLALILISNSSFAQPSTSQLADRLGQIHQERIEQINQIEITSRFTAGMLEGEESTTVYEKVDKNGKYVLEPVESDDLYEAGEMTGLFEDILAEMVLNSSAIENDTYNGYSAYKILVDDPDFLNELSTSDALADDEFDDLEEELITESFTFWLDNDNLVMYHGSLANQGPDGQKITVNFSFSDYETHSGLPVPMVTEVEIDGMEQLFSDEEIAEARNAMREMEEQLEGMPEEQREMIEQQIKPQMERFEQMIESGEMGNSRLEVINVVVN